jgi:carboxymethylenebutenolidase
MAETPLVATPLSVHAPTTTPKGGVVVVQEAFGVNDHIEDICRRLADDGWLAVAPHLFYRTGDPKLGYVDMAPVMEHMGQVKADQVMDDVDAALAHLAAAGIPLAKTGVVGFCMGGTVAFHVTAQRDVGAGITFYGGGVREGRFGLPSMLDAAADLKAPWLGLFGDLDRGIPIADVEDLGAAAVQAGHPTEVVRYAEAEHGFNCDARASFHPASAADAWQRTLAWFDRHLAG